MIQATFAIARVGFLQLVRGRVYLNLLAAGVFLVAAAWVFAELAPNQSDEIIVDVGLAFAALLTVVLAATLGVTTVTAEIENKSVHAIVARPVSRSVFVLGRFVTLSALVVITNVLLGAVLAGLTVAVGGDQAARVFAAALFVSFEGIIVVALAIMFGVGSSTTTSTIFIATTFLLGRLLPSMALLIEQQKLGALGTAVLKTLYLALPQFFRFDLTDWARTGRGLVAGDLAGAAVYGIVYAAALLALASLRFSRRPLK